MPDPGTPPDWWQRFFVELWPDVQGSMYSAERTSTECDLLQRVLGVSAGASLLDVPCGTGRHCIELSRRGFRVTGVELNAEYVATARAAAGAAGVAAAFVVADMRDVTSAERFDAAFCYFGSFGYFSEAHDERFARSVAGCLRAGGRFLVEGHVAETLLPTFRERSWFWVGPPEARARLLEDRTFDVDTGRIEGTWTLVEQDRVRSSSTSIRLYTFRELRELLRRAGFASVRLLDGVTGQEFRFGASRALVVAELG